MFAQWRFVAKMHNQKIEDTLWKQYQEWAFWKVYSQAVWRVWSYELKQKWQIISRLSQLYSSYSSQNIHNLIADY